MRLFIKARFVSPFRSDDTNTIENSIHELVETLVTDAIVTSGQTSTLPKIPSSKMADGKCESYNKNSNNNHNYDHHNSNNNKNNHCDTSDKVDEFHVSY